MTEAAATRRKNSTVDTITVPQPPFVYPSTDEKEEWLLVTVTPIVRGNIEKDRRAPTSVFFNNIKLASVRTSKRDHNTSE